MKKSKAEIKRKYRLKKAIKNIIENHINESYFLTLTFNEKYKTTTTATKRFNDIKKYLNNQTEYYILNIDHGEKNRREHYHALVIAKEFINYKLYSKYGALNITALNSKYKYQSNESKINHLLNHCLKETTNRKIIYSRAKRNGHKAKIKPKITEKKQDSHLLNTHIK